MITSRERVSMALNHREADRVPIDLGASPVTGIHVDEVYLLRQALGLDAAGTPVRVIEPMQMLGEVKPDLMEVLGVDVVPLQGPKNVFGFKNEGWKPWTTFGGTPVLVPENFNTDPEPNGDIMLYPQGDRTAPPSGRMPHGGWYFDFIECESASEDDYADIEENLAEFGPISYLELEHLRSESERLYCQTDKAILANFPGTALGELALIAGPSLKHPRGIRCFEDWCLSTRTHRDYLLKLHDAQCQVALANFECIHQAVGNQVTAVMVTGMDFGMQTGPLLSLEVYRNLYKPFHKRINDWIHQHTTWKAFIHSCGSVWTFIPDFIEAGFDILNPVQCSAANMDPRRLKEKFGECLSFWGGGVDTQHTLPFGNPEDVRREVCERMEIFGQGGGFVFNTTHNIQARVPIPNVLAMYETVRERGRYGARTLAV
jgi:hypothetical protein